MVTQTKKDGIKKDIRLGKEYEVLASKYETSVDYIKKIAKEMRDDGEELVDRKTKKWKTMQIIRKKEIVDDEEEEFDINDMEF